MCPNTGNDPAAAGTVAATVSVTVMLGLYPFVPTRGPVPLLVAVGAASFASVASVVALLR